MKNVNVGINIIVRAKRIIVGIVAYVFGKYTIGTYQDILKY